MEDELSKFQYLWNGSQSQWVLLNVESGVDQAKYLIFNKDSKAAKIIEDDTLAQEVIRRMLVAGVQVVSSSHNLESETQARR